MDSRYGPSRDGRKVLKSAILSGRAPGRVARCSVFIRFVVGSDGEHHRELTGIVTAARFLRDEGRLSPEEDARLEESYDWLDDHLARLMLDAWT